MDYKIPRYIPILRTWNAEFKALEYLPNHIKKNILPIFELTRSRKTVKHKQGSIYKSLDKMFAIFAGDNKVILDITGDDHLINDEIKDLRRSNNGYENWLDFLDLIENEYNLKNIIPTIQVVEEEEDTLEEYKGKLRKQLLYLNDKFTKVVYRIKIGDQYFLDDLEIINTILPNSKILFIIDAEYIPSIGHYLKAIKSIIENLKKIGAKNIAISGSSYPENISDLGKEKELQGSIPLNELEIYYNVISEYKNINIIYSDYATLHPNKKPVEGAQGWIPRIDVTCNKEVIYHRERKGSNKSYKPCYISVATKILSDLKCKDTLKLDCWGLEQIQLAAEGAPGGLNPAFWISVRINIHLHYINKYIA